MILRTVGRAAPDLSASVRPALAVGLLAPAISAAWAQPAPSANAASTPPGTHARSNTAVDHETVVGHETAVDHAADSPALTLGTITVSGSSTGPLTARRLFTSVDIIEADALRDASVEAGWELFRRAPGVQVAPFRQGTDAGRFSFRGFNGEGRINAVKLLIDGIPSNDSAGAMPFLDGVFPQEIEAIEIVRGTNDARYGLNNIAGNVNVVTRHGGNGGLAAMTLGSFGTRDVQLGKDIETGNWSQNYFVGWRDSDGYRAHADARRLTLSGKWFHTSDDGRWRAGLMVRRHVAHALESGYLDARTAVDDPRSSPPWSASDRSRRGLGQASLHLDGSLLETLNWSTRLYLNRYDNQRWVRFTQAGSQQERDNDERHRGLISTMTWRPPVDWAREFTVEAGIDAQWQHNLNQRYRTADRRRTSTIRDWDQRLDTHGAFVQVVIRPVAPLKIVPAFRVDRIGGDMTDIATGATYGIHDYGTIRQPKLSAAWTFDPRSTVYANYGRTFQIGTWIDAYRTQSRDLAPSINDGWEIGWRFSPADGIDGRVAWWRQDASREVARVLGVDGQPDPGGLGNVGRTRRQGYDIQLNAHRSRVDGWIAWSHQVARITEPDPTAPQTRGREVENVPRYLLSAGVDWRATDRWRLSTHVSAQGDYFIERTNTQGRTGRYLLVDVSAAWRVTPAIEARLLVSNLTDRRYVYAWYDSGSSGYSPGDGRAFHATVQTRF